jgi:SAM-dependent methyltransferase
MIAVSMPAFARDLPISPLPAERSAAPRRRLNPARVGKELLVPKYRDVQAFHDRARGYEGGLLGTFHAEIVTRTIDLALALTDAPKQVLNVGCGTGLLLRQLAERLPEAAQLTGVDAAERLPFENASFDLVVSTTSFDHWTDQAAGLAECRRVLAPGGYFVLADLFSLALLPTLIGGRSDRARTRLRATKLLVAAGFRSVTWHRLHSGIIRAVTATA